MYKLVAIDLDGTLLNDDKKISLENINVLQQIIEKGIEVVIATGRRYWSARELVKHINRHMIILANNGNVVRDSKNDEVLSAKYLNLEDFRVIMEEGRKRDLYPIIHVDGYEKGYDMIIELEQQDDRYHNFLQNESRFKKVKSYLDIIDNYILAIVYAGYKKELNSFHLDINKRYPNIYNTHIMENISQTEGLLEIMHPRGTKWNSLVEYASNRGINPGEIIAIGDDNNDIEMIENAGLGIAMRNGNATVKSLAKIVTEKNNNDSGVAFELKRVLNV